MSRILLAATLAVALPLGVLGGGTLASADSRSEQVVFSGTGFGDFGPFGFWVWCAVDSHNPYDDCNGAMYFYGLHLTKHVDGTVSEPADDQYLMDLSSRDGSIVCSLENEPPILQGPHNTVTATCSNPAGSGSSTNAVVTNNG